MDIKIYPGTDENVFRLIGPYAMNATIIRKLGNPITTDANCQWVVATQGKQTIGFCRIVSVGSRHKISNVHLDTLTQANFEAIIQSALKTLTPGQEIITYADAQTLPLFQGLGFRIQKEGKEWHTLIK